MLRPTGEIRSAAQSGVSAELLTGLAAAAVVAVGALVLAGWAFDIPALTSLRPHWVSMKGNTAAGFVLAGAALWLLRRGPTRQRAYRAGQALAGAVALLGLVTLAEVLVGWDLGIDALLFTEPEGAVHTALPGRMSPLTAAAFLLSGLALLCLDRPVRRRYWLAQSLILVPLGMSFIALNGYVFGIEGFYRVGGQTAMALHNAAAFAVLGAGVLTARPGRGWTALLFADTMGGLVARRLLPVIFVLLPGLGWFRAVGESAGLYGTAPGVFLMTVSNVAILTAFVLLSAGQLHRLELLRRQADAALAESEAHLKQARRLAQVGDWHWDLRTGVHVWSGEIYSIYGRDPALPPAGYPEVRQYFTPESWGRLSAAVAAGMAAGTPYACDAEVVRPDGTHRWITARGEAVLDAAGAVAALRGTVQDITQRRSAEEEIRRLNETLEQRVQDRTAELRAANQELDSFSYAVSHDLRAPLRAMCGFSQALIEDHDTSLPAEAREFLHEIALAGQRMGSLVDGLLKLSRSTRGEVDRDVVDLSEVSRRVLDTLARAEPGRQVTCTVESGLCVRGDTRMLEAAMGNLLANAWKYTARAPAACIRVYSEPADATWVVCVADNGIGFDMRHAARLFQPFQRLHREDEFPGIGIGLATVQRIVHRHGGAIRATAAPGEGATFRIELPRGTRGNGEPAA